MKPSVILCLSLFLGACAIFGDGEGKGRGVAYYAANDEARTEMLVLCSVEPERRWRDANCEFAEAARMQVQRSAAREKHQDEDRREKRDLAAN